MQPPLQDTIAFLPPDIVEIAQKHGASRDLTTTIQEVWEVL